jgi:hypothetical protein
MAASQISLLDLGRRARASRSLLFVAALVLTRPALADRVTLVTGGRVDGVITDESPDEVTVRSDIGSVKVKRNRIARIEKAAVATSPVKTGGVEVAEGAEPDIAVYDRYRKIKLDQEEAIQFGQLRVNPGNLTLYLHELAVKAGIPDEKVGSDLTEQARQAAVEDELLLIGAEADHILTWPEIRTWLLDTYADGFHVGSEEGRLPDWTRKEYFEKHADDFRVPDTLQLASLTLPAATPDDELARTAERASKEGSHLQGWREAGWIGDEDTLKGFPSTLAETLSRLPIGGMSDFVTDARGEHVLFRVISSRKGRRLTFEEARALVGVKVIRENHDKLFRTHPNARKPHSENERFVLRDITNSGFMHDMHVRRHLVEAWLARTGMRRAQVIDQLKARAEKRWNPNWSNDL